MRRLAPGVHECASASTGGAECGVDQAKPATPKLGLLTPPRSALEGSNQAFLGSRHSSRGFTYLALLAAIVIIGITLGAAGKSWRAMADREREEELLFRGDQYRRAIERYMTAVPGRVQYPETVDQLLKDNRTLEGKRYLRQRFKDPISGEDFVEVRDQLSRRILGFHSPSDKQPLKQGNFPDPYREFEGKQRYSEWVFLFRPDQQKPPVPLAPGVPRQPVPQPPVPTPPKQGW